MTPHPAADLGDALTTDRQVIFTVKPWVANSAYKLGPGLMYIMRAMVFLASRAASTLNGGNISTIDVGEVAS